ncbi:MAG TPA: TetR/AcrR family transcriptional regulator [Mycobacteriales bacterium]|nr:TetR/AcrR family transcriptional regulator [Mycobacteriales bacterium]
MSAILDRRPVNRGDRRRESLLAALDGLLETGGGLDSISIADITGRAGVTRSAFYFYFENKAAAVAAAGEQLFREVVDAADLLVGDGDPVTRVRGAVRALYDAWRRHEHLFRALLDARAVSPAVREMWRADSALFVEPVAAMVEAERAAGRAPAGADPRAVATVLLDVNERMLERLALGTDLDHEQLQSAVVDVWLRTLYGRPLGDPT